MNNKAKFETFLESLKGNGQDSLIESVKQGFKVCFEGCNALFESVSSIVYHVTHVSNLEKILKDNQFVLGSFLENAPRIFKNNKFILNSFDRRGASTKLFYMSVSKIKHGGFARGRDINGFANIVLDGDKFNQNYEGISVDYTNGIYDDLDPEVNLRHNQNEERILSTKPIIKPSNKYIKEIHLIYDEKTTSENNHRNVLLKEFKNVDKYANDLNIPIFYYDDVNAWKLLDKRRAIKPEIQKKVINEDKVKREIDDRSIYDWTWDFRNKNPSYKWKYKWNKKPREKTEKQIEERKKKLVDEFNLEIEGLVDIYKGKDSIYAKDVISKHHSLLTDPDNYSKYLLRILPNSAESMEAKHAVEALSNVIKRAKVSSVHAFIRMLRSKLQEHHIKEDKEDDNYVLNFGNSILKKGMKKVKNL